MDLETLGKVITGDPGLSYLKGLEEAPTLQDIQVLQERMLDLPQVECQRRVFFADGLGSAVLAIPAGSIIVGKMHKRSHMNMLVKGRMRLWSASSEAWQEVEGPLMVVSPAMEKRMAETITDCVWATFHATDAKTAEDMEADVIYHETPVIEGEGP